MSGPRQTDLEPGKRANLAVDVDRAAMLLGDDIPADRQAEPSSFAGRFGREKWLEQLVAKFGPDADAVVAHADLYHLAEIARRHLQPEARLAGMAAAFVGGIEAVSEQVEQDAGDILRHELNGGRVGVQFSLQSNVEILILGARTMIGEVQRLLHQRVYVGLLPIAAGAARMGQHALDDA